MPSGMPQPGIFLPFKPATLSVLRQLAEEPLARHLVNPGIATRLLREGLIEHQFRPRGPNIYRITNAGRTRLAEIDKRDKS